MASLTINRHLPDSSLIEDIEYNEDQIGEQGTLLVTFNSGKVYRYDNVPIEVVEGFQDADSIGSYFNSEVKSTYTGILVVADNLLVNSQPLPFLGSNSND